VEYNHQASALYGKVSVRTFDGKRLPYIDGLVNLVLADELGGVPMEEIMRVLAPRGVAMIGGKKIVKPWPRQLDEWTHYLYDASGNAVSKDTRVGPPRHLQWTAEPRWARSHEHAASVAAMVSGDGKIYYLHDEGICGILVSELPERWALYARDAFSGVLLWKKKFTDFGSTAWGGLWHCREPMEIPRRLVFGGGKIYATLGFRNAAISVLDPDTGETLTSFQEGKNNDELIWHEGVLLVRQQKSLPDYPLKGGRSGGIVAKKRSDGKPDIPVASMGDETILGLDAETGKVLWSQEESRVVAISLAALGDRVCYHNFQQIVCLDLRSGKELWRADCATWPNVIGTSGTLVIYRERVIHAGSEGIQVFSLDSGERLWKGPALPRMSVRNPPDMFAIDGRIWTGPTEDIAGARNYTKLDKVPSHAPMLSGKSVKGFDVATGEVTKELEIGKLVTPGHHTRCYRSKATSRFLIWPKLGMEFIDVAGGENHERVDWARGECGFGVMPSGGLLYVPPHPCLCYMGVLLDGFNALAPAGETTSNYPMLLAEHRLQQGPAYEKAARSSSTADNGSDWPSLRHDAARSGRTPCEVPSDVSRKWSVDIGGKLTQPVVADGTVYVASVDTHTVYALSADSGKQRWCFTADARIDSPPTIHGALVLFGCSDARVYPVLRGAAEFLLDYLVEDPDGLLVIVPSTSPENSYIHPQTGKAVWITRGSTYHMALVRAVFEAVIEGSKILGTDEELRSKLEQSMTKLPLARIGRDGTIQEWIEDYKEREPEHRHLSHLIGLHPFSLITDENPTLFEAARKTIERRGFGGDVGWSNAWKTCFYARLRNGEKARWYFNRLLTKNALPNLMCALKPGRKSFIVDANFGGTAGFAEMLLQSHDSQIRLLPALPGAWSTGRISGLRARGGFEVDLQWKDGKLLAAAIRNVSGKRCKVPYGEKAVELNLKQGGTAQLDGNLQAPK